MIALVCLLALPGTAEAQTTGKFGHVNIQELLTSMPGYKSAETKLQAFAKQLQDAYTAMQAEYQKKYAELETMQNSADGNKVLIENKIAELVDLEKRMQKLEVSSEEQLVQKQTELLKPIEEQIMSAIKSVSSENGFTYVFDTSSGMLLNYPPADNILPLLKKKLGLQ